MLALMLRRMQAEGVCLQFTAQSLPAWLQPSACLTAPVTTQPQLEHSNSSALQVNRGITAATAKAALQHAELLQLIGRSLTWPYSQRSFCGLGGFLGTTGQQRVVGYSSTVAGSVRHQMGTQMKPANRLTHHPDRELNSNKHAAIPAKVLTSLINKSTTSDHLQELVTTYSSQMNHIHVATAVVRLAALCAQQQGVQDSNQQAAVQAVARQVMQQLWPVLQDILADCSSRELASIICTLLAKLPPPIKQEYHQLVIQQLLPAFMLHLDWAPPQRVSNVLYGLANSKQGAGNQVTAEQLQRLVGRIVVTAEAASPQAISNALVACTSCDVPSAQVQHLVSALAAKADKARSQEIASSLWAVAVLNQDIQSHHMQRLLDAFSTQSQTAPRPTVSTVVWACGRLRFLHQQLLSSRAVLLSLQTAGLRTLCNTAWAYGMLGHRDEMLMTELLQLVKQRLQELQQAPQQADSEYSPSLSVVAWAVAVLDLQEHAAEVLQLLSAVPWDSFSHQHMQQLYQVHWWLLDIQYGDKQGLGNILAAEQLQLCKAAYGARQQLSANPEAAGPTDFQRQVYSEARRLPVTWKQPVESEKDSVDGLLSIDISGTTAEGQLVAIEADGPLHFIAPDSTLDGATQYRNRALAARGYTVVSVPYFEWGAAESSGDRQQYLLQKFREAGVT